MSDYFLISEVLNRLYLKPKPEIIDDEPRTFSSIRQKYQDKRNQRRQKYLKRLNKYQKIKNLHSYEEEF